MHVNFWNKNSNWCKTLNWIFDTLKYRVEITCISYLHNYCFNPMFSVTSALWSQNNAYPPIALVTSMQLCIFPYNYNLSLQNTMVLLLLHYRINKYSHHLSRSSASLRKSLTRIAAAQNFSEILTEMFKKSRMKFSFSSYLKL